MDYVIKFFIYTFAAITTASVLVSIVLFILSLTFTVHNVIYAMGLLSIIELILMIIRYTFK